MLYISDNDVSANEMSVHLIISYFSKSIWASLFADSSDNTREQSGIQTSGKFYISHESGALQTDWP